MGEGAAAFEEAFRSAFNAYQSYGGEAELSNAYELGRRALQEGMGILDVLALHQNITFAKMLGTPKAEQQHIATAASYFIRELLSPFEMTLRGFREANDELLRVNEQLRAQKEAIELANQELEAFSYSASHDLQAPLHQIDGFSRALEEIGGEKLDEKGRQYLAYIRDAEHRMAQVIEALLDLGRLSRADLRWLPVDLSALAREVVDELRLRQQGRKVDVEIETGLTTEGDPRLLFVVLYNLLGNAWKFTGKRAVAHIRVGHKEQRGRKVYFVRDDGAGFDKAYAEKLFGPFQRLHDDEDFEGTGIGLATVKRVVQRHGGKVWAEGEVGRGATFYFTLGEAPHD